MNCVIVMWMLVHFVWETYGNHDSRRLYDDLLRKSNYNRELRPVVDATDTVIVKLGLKLSQLVDVDEKNEILTLNVWVIQEWEDVHLRWDPKQYGDVKTLFVPSEYIWLPDLVLYNNADGDYNVTIMTKATITFNGHVTWVPPAIFKSYCNINVKYFPFDEQECHLKFGMWSYEYPLVDLEHLGFSTNEKLNQSSAFISNTKYPAIRLDDFYRNVEWDIMGVKSEKHSTVYPCCDQPFVDITFNITIRRKTLFYTINLIIPCVALNMLTILAFYLPVDCGEKISLCISLLLSLSLFQLLLMDLVPPTSITMPLFGTYIIFTCVVISISVMSSVAVLNVHYRSTKNHMPYFVRKIFLHILPNLMFMYQPSAKSYWLAQGEDTATVSGRCPEYGADLSNYANPYKKKFCSLSRTTDSHERGSDPCTSSSSTMNQPVRPTTIPPSAVKALDGIYFLDGHLHSFLFKRKLAFEWRYVAMVIDRILLWVYLGVCIAGAMTILLNAPVLYDNKKPVIY